MRVFAALALGLGMTIAPAARAGGPPFLLGVSGCGELDEREVRRLVAAELGAIQVEQRGPDVTLVTVTCGGLRVSVRVDDPLSKKTVQRAFDTGPLDHRARARWIALAASELVLSSWVELETNPVPKVQAEGPAVPAPVLRAAQAAVRRHAPPPVRVAPAAPRGVRAESETPSAAENPFLNDGEDKELPERRPEFERSFRAVGVASFRTFFDDTGSFYGGGLRVSEERFRHMSWSADFLFEGGNIDASKADYRVRSGTLGGWLMLYHRRGGVTARLGAGLRLGVVAALAEDVSSDYEGSTGSESAVAPWGWPLAASSLSVDMGPLVAEFAFEAGYVVLPLGGSSGPSVSGGWCSAQLGLGIRR